jgi:hypothetical protein
VGLEEAFHSVYPKADIQRCVVHKIRNLFPKIRVKDKLAFMSDLKLIYTAPIYEQASIRCFRIEVGQSVSAGGGLLEGGSPCIVDLLQVSRGHLGPDLHHEFH